MLVVVAGPLDDTSYNLFEGIELSLNGSPSTGLMGTIRDRFGAVEHPVKDIEFQPSDGGIVIVSTIHLNIAEEVPDIRGTAVPAFKGPEIIN